MPPISKKIEFGIRGAIPANAEESRTIPFILSTYQKDRHGTVLNQDNWHLDNFKLNPIVAYQHTLSGGMCSDPNPDFVIGKDIKPEASKSIGDTALTGVLQFEPAAINPLAEKIFRKLLFGSLSRSSVGFLEVGEGNYGTGEEAQGMINETYYFAGQELLEWSVVNIPSNPGAGKRDMLRSMREEGYSVLMYAFKELGGKFRLSQIEQFRVCDILDLLDGKDLDLKEADPDKVRKLLAENEAQKDQIQRLTTLINDRKVSLIG
jgi:hypothetical protein